MLLRGQDISAQASDYIDVKKDGFPCEEKSYFKMLGLFDFEIVLDFTGVFRTQSNIYDGTYLRN